MAVHLHAQPGEWLAHQAAHDASHGRPIFLAQLHALSLAACAPELLPQGLEGPGVKVQQQAVSSCVAGCRATPGTQRRRRLQQPECPYEMEQFFGKCGGAAAVRRRLPQKLQEFRCQPWIFTRPLSDAARGRAAPAVGAALQRVQHRPVAAAIHVADALAWRVNDQMHLQQRK